MSKDPAILFYTSDFLSGTAFFTDEQRGQYIRLLCEQHQSGHIPADHMLNICKSYDSPVFVKFQKDEAGKYFQPRMELEIKKRVSYSESRRNNRTTKTYDKDMINHINDHMSNHMGNGNINTGNVLILNVAFEEFWNLYDKKVDKVKCEKKWAKLSTKDKDAIMDQLPEYISATPDKKFRRDPSTYLNNRSWDNEIITTNGQNRQTNQGATAEQLAGLLAIKLGSDSQQ